MRKTIIGLFMILFSPQWASAVIIFAVIQSQSVKNISPIKK
jgi:hypothetical protein